MMNRILTIGATLRVPPGADWAVRAVISSAHFGFAELRDVLLAGRAAVRDARLEINNVNVGAGQ